MNKAVARREQRFIALDLGTACGWASWNGTVMAHGVLDLKVRRHESRGMRLVRFEESLQTLICGSRKQAIVDLVLYESPGHQRSLAASEVLHGLTAVLVAACEKMGLSYMGIPPTLVKKAATGKGNANKEMVRVYAAETLKDINGVYADLEDDNESDAVALACLWLEAKI